MPSLNTFPSPLHYVSAPGKETGPCAEPCAHRDCEALRAFAGSICRACRKPLGYDPAFVCFGVTHYHFSCAMRLYA